MAGFGTASGDQRVIGLVIVTHGRLADAFREAVEHIVGPQEALATICIGPDDDMDARRQQILASVRDVNQGQGVLLLTDMFGGTPSNLALTALAEKGVEVIAGINLPLLVKLVSLRQTSTLRQAAEAAQEAGRKYISLASALLDDMPGA
jgi:PTS system mannose-specific IIA component